ncbi:ABC transporter ATP-binding protein [Nitratireductor mangrovi]|uniref:ABC transporter ATP-binding protein n=1 Tax=Nitratireductor mangrovi TaxID=2599600 RepID=A0A5B8KYM4_9HYPH|nr:ABC transporter ATP-binding protein [Nitratireductor mangrovi]QDZ00568.1 ABC transporter ATP-binding protein [Nitratireductor mangrovi]
MLELNNVEVIYSDVILAVKGVSMRIETGQCVTLLGGNGAGKSTTLKSISNVIKTEDGKVTAGSILFDGRRIDNGEPENIVTHGIIHVMEGRRVLKHLTVEQNLLIGGHREPSLKAVRAKLDEVYSEIGRLAALKDRTSGYLSGGEQQMLVIGRAMMARPKLMMIDEPSLGLAPLMVDEVFALLARLKASGMTLLLVEQNARVALELADYGYVMENGHIVLEGAGEDLRRNEDVREFYLGLNLDGERKSYRDVKHYRRRKRWLG